MDRLLFVIVVTAVALSINISCASGWQACAIYDSSNAGQAILCSSESVYIVTDVLHQSHDYGDTWSVVNKNVKIPNANVIRIIDSTMYIASIYNSVFITKNGGKSYSILDTMLIEKGIAGIVQWNQNIVIATYRSGVYMYELDGKYKGMINAGIDQELLLCMAKFGNHLILGTIGHGIFAFNENLMKWELVSGVLPDENVLCISSDSTGHMIAGTNRGLYYIDSVLTGQFKRVTTPTQYQQANSVACTRNACYVLLNGQKIKQLSFITGALNPIVDMPIFSATAIAANDRYLYALTSALSSMSLLYRIKIEDIQSVSNQVALNNN